MPARVRMILLVPLVIVLAAVFGQVLAASASVGAGPGAGAHGSAEFGRALVGSAPTKPFPGSVAVNSRTNTIYVANGYDPDSPLDGGNTVTVIDGRRCQARNVSRCRGPWPSVKVGSKPSTLAIDQATDTIYATNNADGTVSVINGATCNARVRSGCGQKTGTLRVGKVDSGPLGIYADHAHHTVYVGVFNTSVMALINSATCNGAHLAGCAAQHPPTVKMAPGPGDIDVNPRTHTGYVALLNGVAAFSTRTCNVSARSGCSQLGTVPVPSPPDCAGGCGPFSAKADPANNTIYVADGALQTVSVINGRTCEAADLSGCAAHKPGVVRIGPANGIEGVIWVAVDAPAHTVYVTNHKDNNVSVINASICNGTHLAACRSLVPPTIHTGTNPESVAVDPRTRTVYVGNDYDHSVSVIAAGLCEASTTTGCRHPVPTAAAGSGPNNIAIDPSVHTAYVTDSGRSGASRTVSMISTVRCTARHPSGCSRKPPAVTVGASPDGVAVSHHTAYVTNFGAPDAAEGSVSVISDAACNAARQMGCARVQTMPVPNGHPVAVAVSPQTGTVYVGVLPDGGPSFIDVYDSAACSAAVSSGCGRAPAVITIGKPGYLIQALAVNQATGTLYATETNRNLQGNQLYVMNAANCRAGHTAGCHQTPAHTNVGLTPQGIAVDPVTDTVYVALLRDGEGFGAVAIVNGARCNSTVTTGCSKHPALTTPAGFGTVGLAIDTATRQVYASGIQDTSVTVIDGRRCNATHLAGCHRRWPQAAVGIFPQALAVSHAGHTVYVIDNRGTDLSLIPTR